MYKMVNLKHTCLFAIQEIPGETREEKFKEIGQIVKRVAGAIEKNEDFDSAVNDLSVPLGLVPLVQVLVGVKIKNHEYVIKALKSDNEFLVTEALRARWFFDGSNESITNREFYSTELLPYVSMSTRRKIVKKLVVCLANEHTLAEDFFNHFVSTYGIHEAVNLLPACRSEFIYNAIVEHKIIFSNKLLKILYRKWPDLVVRYFKFMDPNERTSEINRTMFRILNIYDYETFMPMLLTKYPEMFVNMQEIHPTSPTLGNRRAAMLLKNAKEIFIQKPRGVIDLMPIKLVYDTLKPEEFETMFGNIFENQWDMFKLDYVMNYLEYYPEDKKAALIRKKVKERYGYDLYDKVEKLTSTYLLLLPKNERFELTRKIIEVKHRCDAPDYENTWWCYLPLEDAISSLKIQIAKNWKSNKRQSLFSQLVYVCKLNENLEALLGVLQYIDQKHQYEKSNVIISMLDRITQEFELDDFDQRFWDSLFSIIKRIKLKQENARDYWVLIKILKKNVHYYVNNNLPPDDIIDLIIKLFLEGRVGVSWKLLEDQAEFEHRYLDVCFKNNYWLNIGYKKNVVEGIYSFNERHVTSSNEHLRFSLKDYPQLLKAVEETLKKEQNEEVSWVLYTKEKLKKHEPELYAQWFPNETNTPEEPISDDFVEEPMVPVKEKKIYLTEAIIALKRNYSVIKDNWERYYDCCKNEVASKKRRRVKLFLKTLRWYQDVPIDFVKKTFSDKNFNLMAYLLDGPEFSFIAERFLPKDSATNHDESYLDAIHITSAVRNSNSPISPELVEKYLAAQYMYSYKNYINDGLKLWSYVSYRTATDRMITMSSNLSKKRLFLRKHAIRMMNAMASADKLVDFFGTLWKNEEHPVIRELLAGKIATLFAKRPSEQTWNLMKTCIADLKIEQDDLLVILIGSKDIPLEFTAPYGELVLKKLKEFVEQGMSKLDGNTFIEKICENFKSDCTDRLSEDFYKELLNFGLRNCSADTDNTELNRFIIKTYLNPAGKNFDERLKHMSSVLKEESSRWHGLSMEERRNTTNYVENFTVVVVYQVQKFKGNLELLEKLYDIFENIFTPSQHAGSHILLFLCREFLRVNSFKEFGLVMSEKISVLIEKYAPEFFMQFVDYMRDFICNFSFYEYTETIKHRINFLEGLIESKNTNGLLIASKLLYKKIVIEYYYEHCKILQKLSEVDNPLVQSLL